MRKWSVECGGGVVQRLRQNTLPCLALCVVVIVVVHVFIPRSHDDSVADVQRSGHPSLHHLHVVLGHDDGGWNHEENPKGRGGGGGRRKLGIREEKAKRKKALIEDDAMREDVREAMLKGESIQARIKTIEDNLHDRGHGRVREHDAGTDNLHHDEATSDGWTPSARRTFTRGILLQMYHPNHGTDTKAKLLPLTFKYFIHEVDELLQISDEDRVSFTESGNFEHSLEYKFYALLSEGIPDNLPRGRALLRLGLSPRDHIKRTSDPHEADLIYFPALLNNLRYNKQKDLLKPMFMAHLRNLASLEYGNKCSGCNIVMAFGSGSATGYHDFLNVFPKGVVVGVDVGELRQLPNRWNFVEVPYPVESSFADSAFRKEHALDVDSVVAHQSSSLVFYAANVQANLAKKETLRLSLAKSLKDHCSNLRPGSSAMIVQATDRTDVDSDSDNEPGRRVECDFDETGSLRHDSYFERMRSSDFCACPRGRTPASQRMIHAILNVCIPVVISDMYELPNVSHDEEGEFIVRIPENEMDNLVPRLRNIGEQTIRRMKETLAREYLRFTLPYPPQDGDALHFALSEVMIAVSLGKHAHDVGLLDARLAFSKYPPHDSSLFSGEWVE